MAIPRNGDFYINNANQDFWLREGGVWVRKGNIRDEGVAGLVSVNPTMAMGFSLGVQVDRIRFLGSIAYAFGATQASIVSRIRALTASYNLGFDDAVTLQHFLTLAATFGLGYDEAVALVRTQQVTDAQTVGYLMAATLTHAPTTPPGFTVVGLGASPWTMWYDAALTNLTPSWTVPAAAVVAAEVSPDRSLLVIATSSALFRYNISGATPVYLGAFPSPPSWANIVSISFSGDSTRLAVLDNTLSPWCWVYNTSTWASVTAPTISTGSAALDFDGTAAAHLGVTINAATSLKLFDTPGMGASATQPGTQTTTLDGNFAYSPNGAYFAVNGNASPSPFRIWQASSLAAPMSSPGTMPTANAAGVGRAMRFNHASTKLTVCDNFGTYCYRLSGATITLDQTINFNLVAGGAPAYVNDDSKLYLTQKSSSRFAVYTISGNVYTIATAPTVQPASDPTCIATSV